MLILYKLDKLEKLYLSRDKVCDLGTHVFEFNVLTFTIELSRLLGPLESAALWSVLELAL